MWRLTLVILNLGAVVEALRLESLKPATLENVEGVKVKPVPPMLDARARSAWAQLAWETGTKSPLQNESSLKTGLAQWERAWAQLSEEQRWKATHNNSVEVSVKEFTGEARAGYSYCAQTCPEWCWATCICMVRGEPCKDECNYVSKKAEKQCCVGGGGGDACSACGNVAGSDTDIMVYSGGKLEEVPESEDKLQQLMNEGKWLILLISWNHGGGHAVVISGSSGSTYTVMDPLYGMMQKSYAELLNYDGRGKWTGSVYEVL
eukprot:gene13415-15851_t